MKYKFFKAGRTIFTEGDFVQEMLRNGKVVRINSAFSQKVKENVEDVAGRLSFDQHSELNCQHYQLLMLTFSLNRKTNRPDLVAIDSELLLSNEIMPTSFLQAYGSMLHRVDRSVRAFNGLQAIKIIKEDFEKNGGSSF